MDAITFLEGQHHDVESLFALLEDVKTPGQRQQLFERIADALAVHATIEEKIFYPSVHAVSTEDVLLESTEEHLAAKRLIADLLELAPEDAHYAAKLVVLHAEVEHHVNEERHQLFPLVKKIFDKHQLAALGEALAVMTQELKAQGRAPRYRIPGETTKATELV